MKNFSAIIAVICLSFGFCNALAAAPPPNFTNELVLDNLSQPISMTFLPDGRMLLLQKGGEILITDPQASSVTTATYMTISNINTGGERGLVDITLDPDFENNGWFYLYYSPDSPQRFRISRFTHQENTGGLTSTGDLSSEMMLWEDVAGYISCCHYGAGLDFGPDDKIYCTPGDKFTGTRAQDLTLAGGKIIRINKDGSIPDGADGFPANPFIDGPGGNVDSIWAYGLRNPFRARWDIPTERFLIGEVGGNNQPISHEDLHLSGADAGDAGVNFGWPFCEGPCDNPDFPDCDCQAHEDAIFSYPHNGSGASLTGGVVYRGSQFPTDPYFGAYFYGDYTDDFIRYLTFDPNDPSVVTGDFAFESNNTTQVVSIEQAPDGSLYYIRIGPGQLRRFVYAGGNQAPEINMAEASPTSGTAPLTVMFMGSATDPENDSLDYHWVFGDGNDADGEMVSNTYQNNGVYTAFLEVSDATHTTMSEPIEIMVGSPPDATITSPGDNSLFRAGDIISYSATASDPDETLDGSNFSWTVQFLHNEHTHPALGPVTGMSGTFEIPTSGHDYSDDTGYIFTLTVTDSDSLTDTESVTVLPDKVDLTFDTAPSGMTIFLDGIPRTTPFVHDTLIDFEHTISASETLCADGTQQIFDNWSDGGAATHTITVPASDASYTASYISGGECSVPVTDGLVMRLKGDLDVTTNPNATGGGSTVTGWLDQTSSGNDLSVVGGNPTLLAGELNGHDVVSFDGSDDGLGRTGYFNLPTGSADRSVFMVVKYDSDGWGGFSYGNNNSNQTFGVAVSSNEGELAIQGWGNANDFPSGMVGEDAGWLTQAVVLDANTFNHYMDGGIIDTVNHAFNTATTKIRIGKEIDDTPAVQMQLAEVLVYDRALDESERQQIEQYFDQEYFAAPSPTITITTPAEGQTITGDTVTVSWNSDGDLSQADHVHVFLDVDLGTMTSDLDGSFTFTNVAPGAHTATVELANSGHSVLTSDSVDFQTQMSGGGDGCPLITDGLVLHLEADTGVDTTGSMVNGWLDSSGHGNDLSSAGDPQLITGGPNGQSYIEFDGSGDKVERTAMLNDFPSGAGDRTMFTVVRYESNGFGGAAYGDNSCGEAFGLIVANDGDLAVQRWCNDFETNIDGNGVGWLSQSVVVDSNSLFHYQNGNLIASADPIPGPKALNTQLDMLVIGAELDSNPFLTMDTAAVLLYDRALSESEREQVEAYIQQKYFGQTCPGDNSPPMAADDSATVTEGQSVTIDVLANDSDTDGVLNPATVTVTNPPANGSITMIDSMTGEITYLHDGSTTTSDSFVYTVEDEVGDVSNPATVTLTITPSGGGDGCDLVTNGLVLHLESDMGVTETGGAVSGWADQTGLANDFLGSGDPQLIATGGPNGQPFLEFDGDGDKVQRTHSSDPLNGFPDGADDRTIFFVTKYNDAQGVFAGFGYGNGASNQAFGTVVNSNAGELTVQGWGGGNDFPSGVAGVGAGWLSQSVVYESGTTLHYKDGTQIDSDTHTFNTNLDKAVIGEEIANAGFMELDVAAVLLYDRALNETERQQVEAYIQNKYFGEPCPGGNTPPTVTITDPADRSSFESTEMISFAGTANDNEDGDVTASLVWESDIDGLIGTGGSFMTMLSPGSHTITATATDDDSRDGSDSISVDVFTNTPPAVTISSPADGSTFVTSTSINFAGSANDNEDGDVTASLVWESDIDGQIGTGGSFMTTLTEGDHIITATATDNNSRAGSDSIMLTITATGGPGCNLVTNGLVLHLESDMGVTETGGAVSGWADQTGLANDFLGSGDPQLIATGGPNGQPFLEFDGDGDKVQRTHSSDPLNGFPDGADDRTIFFVTKYNDAQGVFAGFGYGNGASNQAFGTVVNSNAGELTVQGWGGGNDFPSGVAGVGAGWLSQSVVYESGTTLHYKDGTQIDSDTHAFNTTLVKAVIGEEIANIGFMELDVAAVLLYDRTLNETERQQVEAYLQNKYFGASCPGEDNPPTVTITEPADNSTFLDGESIDFAGSASDDEDGDVTAGLVWESDIDGQIGTGGSFSTTLSIGTHTITASVTDSESQTTSESITVNVEPVTMSVDIELANVNQPSVSRCITFELFDCDNETSTTVQENINFTNGTAIDVAVMIPPGEYTCVTARDPLHTLRRTNEAGDGFSESNGQYTTDFTGDDALIGGNLNDDAFIDILDFGTFAGQFNMNVGPSDCMSSAPHADISGDGTVFTEDFTFIQVNFLLASEDNCCAGIPLAGGDGPVTEISVEQLWEIGLGQLSVADLNNDGWLNQEDIAAFLNGERPDSLAVFTGEDGASWFDADNWSNGHMPDAESDVTLDTAVTIDQAGAVARAVTLMAGGELTLLDSGSLFAQSLTVNSGATLALAGADFLLSVESLTLQAGSTLLWDGGTIEIDGGMYSQDQLDLIVGDTAILSTLRLLDGAAATIARDTYIGHDAGDQGAVEIIASTFETGQMLLVGYEGEGALEITDGGVVSAANAYAGFLPDGFGEIIIHGANSALQVGARLEIGKPGAGALSLSDGATATAGEEILIGHLGEIIGDGSLESMVINQGVLTPIGTLLVSGAYVQDARGELAMQVSRDSADALSIDGHARFSGVLRIELGEAGPPAVGETIDLITASSWSGGFDLVIVPELSDRAFKAIYTFEGVQLKVVRKAEATPSTTTNREIRRNQ